MSEFTDATTLLLFVAVFIPGFISTRVFDLLVPGMSRDYGKALYEVAGYSFLNYGLWSPRIVAVYAGWTPNHLYSDLLLALAVFVVTPTLLPVIYVRVITGKWLQSKVIDPWPSAWDHSMHVNKRAMILVHMRDGRRIGGTWSGDAFASSYPIPRDLFLSEVWSVDQETGEFIAPVAGTKGLFLSGDDIEMLEFFDLDLVRKAAAT